MKYVVKLDYATFAFTPNSINLPLISDILVGDADSSVLRFQAMSERENSPLHSSAAGLFYKPNNGSKQNPHTLQVSGVGCEMFRSTLPHLAAQLYAGGEQAHFSRLDFCFDVLMTATQWRDLYKGVIVNSIDAMGTDKERSRMKCIYHGYGDETTLYIGSRTSPIFCRVYNKTLQDKTKECAYYERYTDSDGVHYEPHYSTAPNAGPRNPQYFIRFEIETKYRHMSKAAFDPSPLFDSYYSDDPMMLFQWLEKTWRKYSKGLFDIFGDEAPEFETDIVFHKLPIVRGYDTPERFELVVNLRDAITSQLEADDKSTLYVWDTYGARIAEGLLHRPELIVDACYAWERKVGFSFPIAPRDIVSALVDLRESSRRADIDFDEVADTPENPFTDDLWESEINILRKEHDNDC